MQTFLAVFAALCAYGMVQPFGVAVGRVIAKRIVLKSAYWRRAVSKSVDEDREAKRVVGL